jgi:TPR repeat protein
MYYLELEMKQDKLIPEVTGEAKTQQAVLEFGAERNYVLAVRELGNMHAEGKYGALRNVDQALRYYERATGMGDVTSQVSMARLLLQEGKPWTNTARAIQLLTDSSKTDVDATLVLAELYETGRFVKQSKLVADKMYENAASMGSETAIEKVKQMNTGSGNAILGKLYVEGKGVKQDYNVAHRYYTDALKKGYKPAMALLAELAEKEGNTDEMIFWVTELAHYNRSNQPIDQMIDSTQSQTQRARLN